MDRRIGNLAPTTTIRTRRHAQVESRGTRGASHYRNQHWTSDTREIWQIIVHLQRTIEEQNVHPRQPDRIESRR
jgi:hypothetical protein